MKPFPHRYDVRLDGGPAGYADVSADGLPSIRMEAPTTYDGPGDAWSPEHLLLASVEACFLLTFRAVARLSKVEFLSLEIATEGVVDRQDGIVRFTEIVLRPRLVLPAETGRERAQAALEKAKKACLVTASLTSTVRLEPEIAAEAPDLSPAIR
ncbi:MAG: hypothetical protein A3F70_11080 [Acidobacteria bacterium RIFCSPLOWO2_12_FULL_67_14]|nr:MAG: hypothetical protein A3H29_16900 [Acidobacteria bacterium RIFCSPLOWO2_02_FULL_67_21]OFW39084.1 MAG: hypothetical protein A3F70_11080 [Acidobacteria bacterium RIFCSPLOWO2_12_FULL_67_14]